MEGSLGHTSAIIFPAENGKFASDAVTLLSFAIASQGHGRCSPANECCFMSAEHTEAHYLGGRGLLDRRAY